MSVTIEGSTSITVVDSPADEEDKLPYITDQEQAQQSLSEYETTSCVTAASVAMEFSIDRKKVKASALIWGDDSFQAFETEHGTRTNLLKKLTEANHIYFAAVPLSTQNLSLKEPLDQIILENFPNNPQKESVNFISKIELRFFPMFEGLLYSSYSTSCFLSHYRLPNGLSMLKGHTDIPAGYVGRSGETVVIDILLLAIRRNRPVIFINPKFLGSGNLVLQYPNLRCEFVSLSELIRYIEMGKVKHPFFVTGDENNIYLFQPQAETVLQQIGIIRMLIEQFIQTAFSNCLWQDCSEITSKLYLKMNSEQQVCLRLVPTVQGLVVREFSTERNDLLLDQDRYLNFLLATAKALIIRHANEKRQSMMTMFALKTSNESEFHFMNIGSLLIKSGFSMWLESVSTLRAYANGELDGVSKMEARLCYKEVLQKFEAQKEGDIQEAMLMKLAEIEHSEQIIVLEEKELCLKKWLDDLSIIPQLELLVIEQKEIDEALQKSLEGIPKEVKTSFKRCNAALDKFEHQELDARGEKIIDTAIYQLIQYFKNNSPDKTLERKAYLAPIVIRLRKLLEQIDTTQAKEVHICDAFILGLIDQQVTNPSKIDSPSTKYRYNIFGWLSKTNYWSALSSQLQAMLINNGDIVYHILNGSKEEIEDILLSNRATILNRSLRTSSEYVKAVKCSERDEYHEAADDYSKPIELYGLSDFDEFLIVLKDLYELCHHRELIPAHCRKFITRCIPIVRRKLLLRCWPDEKSMYQALSTALSSFKTKVATDPEASDSEQSKALMLTRSELDVIKSSMKMQLTKKGAIALEVQNHTVELDIPLLVNVAQDGVSTKQAIASALSPFQNPAQFREVWGHYSSCKERLLPT